jgi:PAS domain S-box-containing protein
MTGKNKTSAELENEIRDLRQKFHELEDRYQKFSAASLEGILIHENGIIVEANLAAYKLWKCNEPELLGQDIFTLLNPEAVSFVKQNIREKREGIFEVLIKRSTGEKIMCEYAGKEIIYNNMPARVVTFRDISVRKEAEKRAKDIEEQYKRMSEASFEALLIHNNGKITDFNKISCALFGYTPEEFGGMSIFDLAPKESGPLLRKQISSGFQEPYEVLGMRKDGSIFFGELNAKEFTYNNYTARVVAIRDISRRKEDEKKLQVAKDDYETLIQKSPDGIIILDERGKIIFANPKAYQIVRIKQLDEIYGKSILEFVSPEYHEQIRKNRILLEEGKDLPFLKVRAIRIDGSMVEVEYKPVRIGYQGINATLVAYHDIDLQEQLANEKLRYKVSLETNKALKKEIQVRKKVEEKLQTSQEQYRTQTAKVNSIITNSTHLIWTMDRNRKLTSLNKNFSDFIFEIYAIRPTINSNADMAKYGAKVEYTEFWREKTHAAMSGISQHFETMFTKKNKEIVWKEMYLNPIKDKSGKVTEVSGIGHDITEKKIAEEKIKQSLKEKEVLLKEVHHRVKNNLQVISSILNLQSSHVTDKQTLDILKESQDRIKAMSFIHESLYQTKDFTSVNLSEYIHNISTNLLYSYKPEGKKVALKQKVDRIFLNLDSAIPCGLIINELMSNSLKYAFAGKTKGELKISIELDKQENVHLIMSDNGPGLPRSLNFRNTQSLGLQLVMLLVSQLRGSIHLDNKKGAKFTIIFNKKTLNV